MRAVFLTVAAAFAACFAVAACAQVPLPNPNVPLLTNGIVYAVARLSDGSTVIGGQFTRVNGVARKNMAKIKPDGTLDLAWNVATENRVNALAVDVVDNVLIAGEFIAVNDTQRLFLARVSGNGVGTLDPTWNPAPNGSVNTVVIDASQKILIGGLFNHVGQQDRLHIARLSPTGAGDADATWNPSADASVLRIAPDTSGNVFVAGLFETIGGETRHYLAKLSASGTGLADATWNPAVEGTVYAIAPDGAGNVFAGGYFTKIGGSQRSNLAKLSTSGAGDAVGGFSPGVGSIVTGLVVDGATLYVVGDFQTINNYIVGGVAKLAVADAALDMNWTARADSTVEAVALGSGGTVLIGGGFATVDGELAGGFAAIDANGVAVRKATTDAPGFANAILRQPDGGLIIGGHFWKAGDVARNNLLRLRPDGTLDPDFNPAPQGISYGGVYSLARDTNGRIYVGGLFLEIDGQERHDFARLSAAGALDTGWDPAVGGGVAAIAVDDAGYVYVGGDFLEAGRQQRKYAAKLSGTGAGDADPDWNAAADERVFSITIDPAGDVYMAGYFANIGGQPQKYLAKLSPVTGLAYATWNPVFDGAVFAVALTTNGNVYAGGGFTHVGAADRKGIARLSGSGAGVLDATWNPSAQGGSVQTLATDAKGDVYAGGSFTNIGGQSRQHVARLFGLGTGTADPQWNPSATGGIVASYVNAFAMNPNGYVHVAGSYTTIGGQSRNGVATLPTQFDRIFSNRFD